MDAEKVEKVCKGLECCADPGNCDPCPYARGLEEVGCIQDMGKDALSVIRELKAEIDRLKQEKLVNVDKLREKLGFAESCDKCKKDSWQCQRDTYFSEKDFCERLDFAIEELIKEGR